MEQSTSQLASVTVAGATLRYAIEGTGRPVLVIGSATYYQRTFSRPLREVCTLAFADLRHFVECDAALSVDRLSFDTYADDIERIRVTLGFKPVVVVGHSHHGNLALEYAKRYPDSTSHVVLIGSPPCGVTRTVKASDDYWAAHASEHRKAALRHHWDALSSETLASLSPGDAFIAQYLADGPKYWYDPHYDASPLWQNMHVNMDLITSFRGLFAEYELSWDPTRLQAPVLIVMGRYDYVVPHVLWDEVLPGLQNVTYHVFERSGHTPQLEEPQLFDQIFLDWLRKEAVSVV